MDFTQATDTQLLQIIYHEPGVTLSMIQEAAEEYRRRHGQKKKWWSLEGHSNQKN